MINQYQADITRLTTNDSGRRDPSTCQAVVLHTYECPRSDDLVNRAKYQEVAGSSYTILVGLSKTLRANDDNYIPWAAAQTGNRIGLHLSFLAYAASTRAEWLRYRSQLELAAEVVADWCQRYGIPAVKITPEQLQRGQRGICGHYDISLAWRETDHTDPGPNFPWDEFLEMVANRLRPSEEKGQTMASEKVDRIYHELTHDFQSRYKTPTGQRSTFRDTAIGYALESDAKLTRLLDDVLPEFDAKLERILKAVESAE